MLSIVINKNIPFWNMILKMWTVIKISKNLKKDIVKKKRFQKLFNKMSVYH